jgi:hypothetical protein
MRVAHTVIPSSHRLDRGVTQEMTPAPPLHRHPERTRGGKAGARRLCRRQTAMPAPGCYAGARLLRKLGGESKDPMASRSNVATWSIHQVDGSRGHGILRLRLHGPAVKPSLRMTVRGCSSVIPRITVGGPGVALLRMTVLLRWERNLCVFAPLHLCVNGRAGASVIRYLVFGWVGESAIFNPQSVTWRFRG